MERLAIEANGARLDEQRFPGRQGRILFAYLAGQKGRPVPRDKLAELLWGDELPATWEKALRVLMTKLRALLDESGIDGSTALTSAFGCYQLTLPDGAWIDVDAATDAVARGEAALAEGNLDEARARASAAVALARRSFLPGEDGAWVEEKRGELHQLLVEALECQRDASFAAEDFSEAVRHAQEVTELEPFRESGYRRLMEAHAAAGNPAEALRVYERCRRFLGEELGAYPSAETEAVYLELLRSSPKSALVDAAHPEADDAPEAVPRPRRRRRTFVAAGVGALLVVAAATAIATTRGGAPPPEVLPTSLVRLDPETLKPTKVVRIGSRADLVVAAGDYLWVTHGILRYTKGGIRNAGDRALTRVDPATGEAENVGGGVAPCGMTPDPSGDVWVLNCYASGQDANVQRIDARTLDFKETYEIKDGGFIRGMRYGGGWLWLTDNGSGARRVIKLNPRNGRQHPIHLPREASWLTWSDGYGDLWISNFGEGVRGSVMRVHAEGTRHVTTYDAVESPAYLLVQGDSVWVADWDNPDVARLPAFGSSPPRHYRLPVRANPAGVVNLAAGYGAIWATVPDDHAVWRIDLKTGEKTRIPLQYYPWGITVADDGIWVSVRAHDA